MIVLNSVRVYLGLGSNIGDSRDNFRAALDLLEQRKALCVVAVSSLYGSKAYGVEDQPDFTNAVIEARTNLEPLELLRACKAVEQELGRVPSFRWGPRLIDIDLLIYDNESFESPDLTLPHTGLMVRPFVLVPLAEVAPDLVMPSGASASAATNALGPTGLWVLEDSKWRQ